MHISYKGDYSLKVILDLSNYYPDNLVHIEDLSKRQDIPKKFLEQILLELKKGGFVFSKKGPNGGYYLAKNPKDISLGEIVKFIEGPIHPISCINPELPETCKEINRCAFFPVWKEVEDAISNIIDNINFEELKNKSNKLKEEQAYTYYI